MTEPILVKFISEPIKKKYKTYDALKHSWSNKFYAVLKLESFSETGEGQVVLCNDLGQIWWVSNRDVLIAMPEEYLWDGK